MNLTALSSPATLVAIDRNGWSRSIGMSGRDRRNAQAVCAAAQISGVRVHDLRHSFASLAVSGGESLPTIGALLGHSRPDTTARYSHLADSPLRRATERVGAIIRGAKS